MGGSVVQLALPYLGSVECPGLLPFQRRGVARLLRSDRLLLADDMGLGKTVQCICAMRSLHARGSLQSSLIVAPATLVSNWMAELARWAPELTYRIGSPQKNGLEVGWDSYIATCDVVVTNYEDLRSGELGPEAATFGLLVLDEAHRIKNWESATNRSLQRVGRKRTWILTGTPLENTSADLATLLSFVDPQGFAVDDARMPIAALRSRAVRLVLRREKKDVLDQLPEVTWQHEVLELSDAQKSAYRRASRRASDGNALQLFTLLRTICDYDPGTGSSAKIERILDIAQDVALLGEKIVVFSYLLEPLRLAQVGLRRRGIKERMLVGEMSLDERDRALVQFKETDCTVLLASVKVAGEGLTLVEANHVVFLNRWWNPSLNNQALDRVRRIGQTRRVIGYAFTMRNTVEARLDEVLDAKNELFDVLVRSLRSDRCDFDAALSALSAGALRELNADAG